MTVNSKDMQGVPVRTVSGQRVGKLLSFEIEPDTGRMAMIRVKISGVLPAMLGQEALVAWAQIVSLGIEEVVVADGFVAEHETRMKSSLVAPPVHAAMREIPSSSSQA